MIKTLCLAIVVVPLNGCVYFPTHNTQIALVCDKNISQLIQDSVIEPNFNNLKDTKCSKTKYLMFGVTW